MDVSARALDPSLKVIAPARVWDLTRPRRSSTRASAAFRCPRPSTARTRSTSNLWGRSIECGCLDDPWQEPPEEIYTLTKSPADAPDTPAYVEIEFERGVPVKINGVAMSLVELIQSLETIAGDHGVGRVDMVENRLVGNKSREIYEAPAAVVLHAAHRELQKFVTPRDLERLDGRARREVRRPRLQRPLVHADARGDRRARRERPGDASPASSGSSSSRATAASSAASRRTRSTTTHGDYDQGDSSITRRRVRKSGAAVESRTQSKPQTPRRVRDPSMSHISWSGRFAARARRRGLRLRQVARRRPAAGRRRHHRQPGLGRGARPRRRALAGRRRRRIVAGLEAIAAAVARRSRR